MLHSLRPLARQGEDPPSAFIGGMQGRPLRLLLDRSTITNDDALEVLDACAEDEAVEAWATTNGQARWVEICWHEETNDCFPVRMHSPGRTALASLDPASTWRLFAQRVTNEGISIDENLRQLGYGSFAANHRFDLVVSDSPQLLKDPVGLQGRVNIRSSAEAVAQLALLLRSRGNFALADDRAFHPGRNWFYILGSRFVLPASSRWFSGCQLSSKGEDPLADDALPPTIRALGQKALERIEWSLRARDHILWSYSQDLIVFYLDILLLQLCGAFDAVAQVTASGLNVHLESGSPSWRKPAWRDKLAKSHSALAAVMAPQSPYSDALEIVSLLRNSIHEGGLPAIGMRDGQLTKTVVRTPQGPRAAPRFGAAIERRGGEEVWGIERVRSGTSMIDPLKFVERAIVESLRALNAIMVSTPVEEFPNVDTTQLRDGNYTQQGPFEPWSKWTRDRVLLLMGLREEVDGFEAKSGLEGGGGSSVST
jgi:hypothetical protein